ncbi:hypothetical protein GGD61_005158 [Bradyrhizobium sp. SBR1B]|nr:hypothetical protein [Bradyrhizobium sp. SBR1B]
MPCASFGDHGQIDLKEGSEVRALGFNEGTSPPVVTDKVLIVGGAVIDNYSDEVPSGVIRSFDIYSGRLIWAFDAGNPDLTRCRRPHTISRRARQIRGASPRSMKISGSSMSRSARALRISGAVAVRLTRSVTIQR